jgi:perosamine synthetase
LNIEIPLSSPDLTQAEIDAVTNVLRSGRLSLGEKLSDFESAFASYTGAPHAVAVSSGTAALHLAIRALGIGEGDEVILPSFAFIAVANAVRYERAVPVFVDIDPHTLNLDPDRIEEAITPHTRAILVVHTFGVPAAMDRIMHIARRHGLYVIEDACEALGAELHGRKVGTFGDIAVFGFYPNKQITTAEGGMALTANTNIADCIRSLRNHGRPTAGQLFQHSEIGYNYRLSELHCALGIQQLKRVEEILKVREVVAHRYHERLVALTSLRLPILEIPGSRISWFVYVLRLAESANPTLCDTIADTLAARGIATGRYFPPIHRQPAYRDLPNRVPLPITESVAARTLALPFFNRITDEQLEAVCAALEESPSIRSYKVRYIT